jgi:hypothetical protein
MQVAQARPSQHCAPRCRSANRRPTSGGDSATPWPHLEPSPPVFRLLGGTCVDCCSDALLDYGVCLFEQVPEGGSRLEDLLQHGLGVLLLSNAAIALMTADVSQESAAAAMSYSSKYAACSGNVESSSEACWSLILMLLPLRLDPNHADRLSGVLASGAVHGSEGILDLNRLSCQQPIWNFHARFKPL